MSIELDKRAIVYAIDRVADANDHISAAMRALNEAEGFLRAEMTFGNDPCSPAGATLEAFAHRVSQQARQMVAANMYAPNVDLARAALVTQTAPASVPRERRRHFVRNPVEVATTTTLPALLNLREVVS